MYNARVRSKIERLKDQAWKIWSEYIRRRDNCVCYTCGAKYWDEEMGEWSIKGLEAGHYKHGVLDFDEMNIHCQCTRCNHYYSGMLDVYSENLIRDYGLKKYKDLCNRAKKATKGHKYTEEEYEEIITRTKIKLARLQNLAN